MVRAIAGTLVDVGAGRRPPEELARLLQGAPRSTAGPTAPAHGLTLLHVEYAEVTPQAY
jgi:tRNA pseudouridine38-40 synthase